MASRKQEEIACMGVLSYYSVKPLASGLGWSFDSRVGGFQFRICRSFGSSLMILRYPNH